MLLHRSLCNVETDQQKEWLAFFSHTATVQPNGRVTPPHTHLRPRQAMGANNVPCKVIQVVAAAWPEAVHIQCKEGLAPLHFGLSLCRPAAVVKCTFGFGC